MLKTRHDRRFTLRLLCDVIDAAVRGRVREGTLTLPHPSRWTENMPMGRGKSAMDPGAGADVIAGLDLDSIDLLAAAGRVNEFFHLHESGIEDHLLGAATIGAWTDIVLRGLEVYDDRVSFLTSGSTGTPKVVTHEAEMLDQESEELARRFAGRARVVSLVPTNHLFGYLFTVMLPTKLGVGVLDARQMGAGALARELMPTDLIVSIPAMWEYLLTSVRTFPGCAGVSSTSPMKPALHAGLISAGLGSLMEIYGSTETGGIGVRLSPGDAYTLHPFWERAGDDRIVRVRAGGGRGEPVELMDHVAWESERALRVLARRDRAVKVAGINVFPSRVEEILRQHQGVREVRVRLMRAEEGDRLKAFIVPGDEVTDRGALREAIDEYAATMLSSHERPRSWTFGDALPTNAIGKNADW
jgi:4-coumarate--CoA ligase